MSLLEAVVQSRKRRGIGRDEDDRSDSEGVKASSASSRQRLRLVIVGHSLGGATAIRLAASPSLAALADLAGLVVVEMAEEPAKASIPSLRQHLLTIPKTFQTTDEVRL